MAPIFDVLSGIVGFITAFFSWCIYAIDGTVQIIDTAFTVIQCLPHYFLFIPAGGIAILGSAFGIHILRTLFGR